MSRLPTFKVRRRAKSWTVEVAASVSKTGRRERLFFKTRAAANARAVQLREEHFKFGVAAHKLPHELQIDAVKAAEILEPYGVSLAQAAAELAERRDRQSKSIEFGELFKLYLTERSLAETTYRDYRHTCNRFAPYLGGKLICEIGADDIRDAFNVLGLTPSRRNLYKRILSAVWNFAIKREMDTRNPLEKIETEKVEKAATEILTPDQAAKLMAAAHGYDGRSMLAYFAIGLFAGVRPAELRRLTWADVDLEKGHIYVSAGTAKTRTDRYVDIEPALGAWLAECPRREGRICPFEAGREFYGHFVAVREAAGLKDGWPNDVMRHSYCSYWLGLRADQNRLVEMAGHSIRVNLKHYRRATTKAEAIEFWTIVPEGCEKPALIEAA